MQIQFPPNDVQRNISLNGPHFLPPKYLAPIYNPNDKCICNFEYNPKDNIKNVHNTKVLIHIREVTDESRVTLFRPTMDKNNPEGPPPCLHKQVYTGEQHGLLRIGGDVRNTCHLIAYSTLFEYFFLLTEGALSIDAYINALTSLKKILSNQPINICPRNVCYKGFEIFISVNIFCDYGASKIFQRTVKKTHSRETRNQRKTMIIAKSAL